MIGRSLYLVEKESSVTVFQKRQGNLLSTSHIWEEFLSPPTKGAHCIYLVQAK